MPYGLLSADVPGLRPPSSQRSSGRASPTDSRILAVHISRSLAGKHTAPQLMRRLRAAGPFASRRPRLDLLAVRGVMPRFRSPTGLRPARAVGHILVFGRGSNQPRRHAIPICTLVQAERRDRLAVKAAAIRHQHGGLVIHAAVGWTHAMSLGRTYSSGC